MNPRLSISIRIQHHYPELTGKGKALADYVLATPDKAVFMTTRQLSDTVGVSKATVVRFVRQLGYDSYARFISALREILNTDLSVRRDTRLSPGSARKSSRRHQDIKQMAAADIERLSTLAERIDVPRIKQVQDLLKSAGDVHVIGSRLSYTAAYYMGCILSKVRKNVFTHNGSNKTVIDRMVSAAPDSMAIIFAVSRYPNQLIRIGKLVKRRNMQLILITDNKACPLVPFSDQVLTAPVTSVPYIGNPAPLICLAHYLVRTLAADMGGELKDHQAQLEQAWLENDVLFNY